MGDRTPHFSTAEFVCRGQGQPGHRSHPAVVSEILLERLETLRALAGDRPLVIVSGHRCAVWNDRVGGAARSQHLRGTAADIRYRYATVRQAELAGFTGIGSRDGWAVHVDVRPARARWSY